MCGSTRRVLAAALAVSGVCAGCAGAPQEEEALPPVTVTVTQTSAHPSSTAPAVADLQTPADAAVAAGLAVGGGNAGVGLSRSGKTAASGMTAPVASWSTSKVPLAIAAVRAQPDLASTAVEAITVSDNAAAQALWDALGSDDAAAAAVQSVIAESGEQIVVPAVVTRPGFSAFGQTLWSVDSQARFAEALPRISGSDEVIALMGQISPAHSYGLGTVAGCAFKGGWGPDDSGLYTARQLGILPDGTGVALYAAPSDGTYETAQQMLSAMAAELPQ